MQILVKYGLIRVSFVNHYAILADRTKPNSLPGFDLGNKSLAGLPKVRSLYYFLLIPSNLVSALGVCFEPANKKKSSKILISTRLRCAGKGLYTSLSGH